MADSWMVIRQAYGGEYWEKTSYGPMSAEDADRMVASQWGGYKVRTKDFQKEYYR